MFKIVSVPLSNECVHTEVVNKLNSRYFKVSLRDTDMRYWTAVVFFHVSSHYENKGNHAENHSN